MYLDHFRLDGRIAFVTGGAQGIGYCVAEALSEAGAIVAIGDRDAAAIDTARAGLAAKGYTVSGVELDVTPETAVTKGQSGTVRIVRAHAFPLAVS